MAEELVIRPARPEDAPVLLSIYAPYVQGTTITFETEVPTVEEFERRILTTLTRYPYLVAERGGKIAGYAYASAYKPRAAYAWSVETSVYVESGARGCGIGGALYGALEDALSKMRIVNLNACITYPNPQSVGFHEKHGYRLIGVWEKVGFKFGKWLDIVWMEKFLGPHEVPPEPVVPYPETL